MHNKAVKFAILLAFLLVTSAMMLVPTPVEAQGLLTQASEPLSPDQVPAGTFMVKTEAFLSVRPTKLGLGQTFLVNFWITPPLHRYRKLTGYKVTMVKPSGKTETVTMDSYYADATAWFEWIADEAGTWKIKFEFPGGYFTKANLTGSLGEPAIIERGACYYEPASTDWMEIEVIEGYTALSWPESPLPTDYWGRPIPPEQREWWSIGGHYPWRGPADSEYTPNWKTLWNKLYPNTNIYYSPDYAFVPWVQAPGSAHVVWKRQGALSGIIGGELGRLALTTGGGSPSIIFMGRCYQSVTKVVADGSVKSVWQCYDLRTGEIYWERTGVSAPSLIEYEFGAEPIPGAEAWVSVTVSLLYIGGGRLIKYDPWNGNVRGNYSISPLTTGYYYKNGYCLTVQDLGEAAGEQRYRLINWTTLGTSSKLSGRVVGNITWPWNIQPFSMGTTITYAPGTSLIGNLRIDFEANIAYNLEAWVHNPYTGTHYGINVSAVDLKTGQLLWRKEVKDFFPFSWSTCIIADHGKFVVLDMNGTWWCWDRNGNLVWKSERMAYPWSAASFGAYSRYSAYGMFFWGGYDGVYAFNWTNGKIVWKYEYPAPYPYEVPYIDENGTSVYPFMAGGLIADGKLYIYNTEHTPSQPITRGWKLHCIDVFTGKGIWNVTLPGSIGAIADGYMTVSGMDGYMYVFGKGKSQTTVTVSQDVVSKGSTILIKGTVLDMSPAQPGTPCVSKESMGTWMDYLHRQLPIPDNIVINGVPVALCAISEKGEVIDLGTVTTNGYYGTFAYAWTPEKEGTYTIVASFEGDESYSSSSAGTAITIGPPPEEIEIPEYPTPTDYTPMLTALAIAVIVVAILVVYAIVSIRKLRK